VFSANYNTLGAVLPTGDNSLPTLNSGDNPGSDTAGTNSDQKYINADKDKNIFGLTSDSDLLYIILGSVLGLMILILIVFVAVCGFKQRQRRRTVLGEHPVSIYVELYVYMFRTICFRLYKYLCILLTTCLKEWIYTLIT